MRVMIELVRTKGENTKEVVEVRDGLKGERLFNAVNKAVHKAFSRDDTWERWNLLRVE